MGNKYKVVDVYKRTGAIWHVILEREGSRVEGEGMTKWGAIYDAKRIWKANCGKHQNLVGKRV